MGRRAVCDRDCGRRLMDREQRADQREQVADERERLADERERLADAFDESVTDRDAVIDAVLVRGDRRDAAAAARQQAARLRADAAKARDVAAQAREASGEVGGAEADRQAALQDRTAEVVDNVSAARDSDGMASDRAALADLARGGAHPAGPDVREVDAQARGIAKANRDRDTNVRRGDSTGAGVGDLVQSSGR